MKLESMVCLLMERLLVPCTDKIVCISKSEESSAEREYIARKDKLKLISNGIDVDAVRDAVAFIGYPTLRCEGRRVAA